MRVTQRNLHEGTLGVLRTVPVLQHWKFLRIVRVAAAGAFSASLAWAANAADNDALKKNLADKARPLLESVRGGVAFKPENRMWMRITGKPKVLNAHTLLFEDGTEIDLNGGMDGLELEQKGLIGDSLYPCGKEAAEFLRKLIRNRTVTCYLRTENFHGKKGQVASAFVGETNLDVEMVRNGWAISDHNGMDPWEIIARENKRGLWRGQFVVPTKWRAGERLPGE